jgi:hypothetical protein
VRWGFVTPINDNVHLDICHLGNVCDPDLLKQYFHTPDLNSWKQRGDVGMELQWEEEYKR